MAQADFDHVEAPGPIRIDGALAFQKGDAVPVETAKRIGLLEGSDAPKVIEATVETSSDRFVDAPIVIDAKSEEPPTSAAQGSEDGTQSEAAGAAKARGGTQPPS